ncbi:hypothetical protein [Chryseobacterium hagamense]|uniref:Uncharacterized protein n=1 Tax=Chryseobacterium hagamense TaxID=395935 RepID=A0A511YQ92_9FLAO|nr:hypothetical protein [Chryseobacterium hagamense]GEN77362.1 hypothetical protein CHA01nite_31020 [Chryseobacterium hagamense]
MKNLLIVIVIFFLSCSKKETVNINAYQIMITYIGPRDAPPPEIVLRNSKTDKKVFPVTNYQIEKEDLMKIEEACYSEKTEAIKNSLVLVEINKDNHIKKYYFNKERGLKILDRIQDLTSHYNNKFLNNDFLNLKFITKQDWYNDEGIIGR